MIKTKFGIIDKIDPAKDYFEYEPKKYNCVCIGDDIYIDDWWGCLTTMKTFFHCINRPSSRWGITLIPSESLPIFEDIVITDKRINTDEHLADLANKIREAITANKYMIHYGV